MPDYRVGDAAFAGQSIADLIDSSRIEATAKLPEQDRANVAPGQSVEVAVDAVPEAPIRGTVRTVSGVASRRIFDAGTRQFDIAFDLGGHPAVRPGVSAAIAISGQAYDNVLYIPRTAVFDVSGRRRCTALGRRIRRPEVRVRAWTDSVAVVENIDPSAEVALVNPNSPSGSRQKPQRMPRSERLDEGRAVAARSRTQRRQPAAAQASHAAHDAGDDLRRGGGGGDAVDWRRRATAGDGVHRRSRRAQSHRRSARDDRVSGLPEIRQQSPGLTFKDVRAMQATVPGLEMLSPRKRFTPSQVIPKPQGELPVVYGVEPNYRQIAALKIASGRFFTAEEAARAAPVCVLGDAASVRLFGLTDPLDRFVKVAAQWYQVIGVAGAQAVAQSDIAGVPGQDRNNAL